MRQYVEYVEYITEYKLQTNRFVLFAYFGQENKYNPLKPNYKKILIVTWKII